eukprot:403354807
MLIIDNSQDYAYGHFKLDQVSQPKTAKNSPSPNKTMKNFRGQQDNSLRHAIYNTERQKIIDLSLLKKQFHFSRKLTAAQVIPLTQKHAANQFKSSQNFFNESLNKFSGSSSQPTDFTNLLNSQIQQNKSNIIYENQLEMFMSKKHSVASQNINKNMDDNNNNSIFDLRKLSSLSNQANQNTQIFMQQTSTNNQYQLNQQSLRQKQYNQLQHMKSAHLEDTSPQPEGKATLSQYQEQDFKSAPFNSKQLALLKSLGGSIIHLENLDEDAQAEMQQIVDQMIIKSKLLGQVEALSFIKQNHCLKEIVRQPQNNIKGIASNTSLWEEVLREEHRRLMEREKPKDADQYFNRRKKSNKKTNISQMLNNELDPSQQHQQTNVRNSSRLKSENISPRRNQYQYYDSQGNSPSRTNINHAQFMRLAEDLEIIELRKRRKNLRDKIRDIMTRQQQNDLSQQMVKKVKDKPEEGVFDHIIKKDYQFQIIEPLNPNSPIALQQELLDSSLINPKRKKSKQMLPQLNLESRSKSVMKEKTLKQQNTNNGSLPRQIRRKSLIFS